MAATMQQQQAQAQPGAQPGAGQQPGPNYPMASLYVGDLAPEVGTPNVLHISWKPLQYFLLLLLFLLVGCFSSALLVMSCF